DAPRIDFKQFESPRQALIDKRDVWPVVPLNRVPGPVFGGWSKQQETVLIGKRPKQIDAAIGIPRGPVQRYNQRGSLIFCGGLGNVEQGIAIVPQFQWLKSRRCGRGGSSRSCSQPAGDPSRQGLASEK